jgi:hypothetical protein
MNLLRVSPSLSALGPTQQKERDRHNGRPPEAHPYLALAFGSNRWRGRSFALASERSGLRRGRDAKEGQRRCRQ